MAAVDLSGCIQHLRSCGSAAGRQFHQLLLKSGYLPASLHVSNSVLHMYARCSTRDARLLFDEMPHKNCFSYNSLLSAHLDSHDPAAALQLFRSIPEKNIFSWKAAITGFARAGDLDNARRLLEEMPAKDGFACNSVMHGYVRRGCAHEAFALFRRISLGCGAAMPSPCNDSFVLATVVGACADTMAYELGRQVHGRMVVARVELDSVLGSALVNMYSKCGNLHCARRVIDSLPEVDDFSLSALVCGYASSGMLYEATRLFDREEDPGVVLWNSIINGCVSGGHADEAFGLFVRMTRSEVVPDSSTYAILLNVCGFLGMARLGQQIHGCGFKSGSISDIVATSALIDCYSKCSLWDDACRAFGELRYHDTIVLNTMISVYSNCGRMEEARRVFNMIPSKSLISWNSMIVGLSQNGHAIEALRLFCELHRLGPGLDKVAIASALSASSSICSISFGEQIFALAVVLGLQSDLVVTSSLIDLYCKCGLVVDGRTLFNRAENSDEVLWNSMLIGYASNGYGQEALELLHWMRSTGLMPTERTFIGVLSACCHCGLVEEGLTWFHRMKEDYGINPSPEHYACVADLLVRAGRLEEAVEFIDSMPFNADAVTWTAVLGGCKAQGNAPLMKKVTERMMQMKPRHSSSYVQLSSALAARGDWEKSAEVRGMMRHRRIAKNPGYSWMDN